MTSVMRADIEARFRELAALRFRAALDECLAVVAAERATLPAFDDVFRAVRGSLREPG